IVAPVEKLLYVSAIAVPWGGRPTMRDLARLLAAVAMTAAVVTTAPRLVTADEFKTGEMIDQNNWQKAEKLLPPEILKHYKEGEYANKFVDWPASQYTWPTDLKAGTDANAGKFTTSPTGTIIDKSTGKQPPYVIGYPFPTIDPSDPEVAVKIL